MLTVAVEKGVPVVIERHISTDCLNPRVRSVKTGRKCVFNHASLKFSLEHSIKLWCVIYMTSNIFLEVCPNFNKFPAVIFASSLFFQFRPLNPKCLKESLKKPYASSNLQGDCVGLGYLYPSVIDGNLLEQESCGHLRQFGWGPRLANSGTFVAGMWRWRRSMNKTNILWKQTDDIGKSPLKQQEIHLEMEDFPLSC